MMLIPSIHWLALCVFVFAANSNCESPIPANVNVTVLQCYQGIRISAQGRNVVDSISSSPCIGSSSCLLVTAATQAMLPGGIEAEGHITYASCLPTVACDQLGCDQVLSQSLSQLPVEISIGDCSSRCCQSDLCNVDDENPTEEILSATTPDSTTAEPISSTDRFIDIYDETTAFPDSCGFDDVITEQDLANKALWDPLGFIESPDYPNNYEPNLDCYWNISAPEGYFITVSVSDLLLESCCDFLTATELNGDFRNIDSIGNYSFRSNFIALHFTSDDVKELTGFSLTYGAVSENEMSLPATTASTEDTTTSRCYQVLRISALGNLVTNQVTPNQCEEASSCLLVKATTRLMLPVGEVEGHVTYGSCVPSLICDQLTCNQILSQSLSDLPGGVSIVNCSTECCQGDLCNDDDGRLEALPTVSTNETSSLDTTASTEDTPSMSCYQTLLVSTQGNLVINQATSSQCIDPSYSCLQVKATARLTLPTGIEAETQITYGSCIPSVACGQITCNQILSQSLSHLASGEVTINDCSAQCCKGNLCNANNDTLGVPTTESTGGNSSLTTAASTKDKTTSRCYQLLRISALGNLVTNQVTPNQCEEASSCLLVKATARVMLPVGEVEGHVTYGSCVPSLICDQITCNQILSQSLSDLPAGLSIGNCSTKCCQGDLCNDDDGRLEASTTATLPNETFNLATTTSTEVNETTGCGSNIRIAIQGSNGTLSSPSLPSNGNYPNDANCSWLLQAPEDLIIRLTVVRFSTEICCDNVVISDPYTGIEIAKLFGFAPAGQLVFSSSNRLGVVFTSDDSVTQPGFEILYTAVDPSERKIYTTTAVTTTTSTTCGFNTTATAEQQQILSPGFPGVYPSSQSCMWTITAPEGLYVKVTARMVNVETCCDTLWINEDNRGDTYLATGDEYTSSGNEVLIKFISDSSVSRNGFRLSYQAVDTLAAIPVGICGILEHNAEFHTVKEFVSPQYPQIYPNSLDCVYTFRAPVGSRISFKFVAFASESCCDHLKFYDGVANVIVDTPFLIFNGFIADLTLTRFSLTNVMTVQFTTDTYVQRAGFNMTYTASDISTIPTVTEPSIETTEYIEIDTTFSSVGACGTLERNVEYQTTEELLSPNYPQVHPNDLNCIYTFQAPAGSRISFKFAAFVSESCCDQLKFYDGLADPFEDSAFLILKGSVEDITRYSLSNVMTVQFKTDGSFQHIGFNMSYTAIDESSIPTTSISVTTAPILNSCGFNATATDLSQTFSSPGSRYPANAECYWSLRTRPGYQVNLTFSFIDTESCCDYLDVFDGNELLERLQGDRSGDISPFISRTGTINLAFKSDSYGSGRGFEASFIETDQIRPTSTQTTTPEVPAENVCGWRYANATSVVQTFTSPGWSSGEYQSSLACNWTITARQGYQVMLTFSSFSTESCCDVLWIDGGAETVMMKGNQYQNVPIVSVAGSLFLRFTTDGSVNERGFEASFVEIDTSSATEAPTPASCGFEVMATNESQTLKSPGWPEFYGNNLNCVWRITAQPGRQIQINFLSFNTEECCDSLKINSTGFSDDEYKGDSVPSMIVSTAGVIILTFKSDGSVTRAGFEAVFVETGADLIPGFAPCGFVGFATNVSQELNSPGFPRKYDDALHCVWQLTAAEGMRIEIQFISLNTENCCDYLSISDGRGNNEIERVRGDIVPSSPIRSHTSSMRLVFISDASVNAAGFQATYTAVSPTTAVGPTTAAAETTTNQGPVTCGFEVTSTNTPQNITSPNYPNNYSSSLECRWILHAPTDDSYIFLDLQDIDTEGCCDHLVILDSGIRVSSISGTEFPFPVYMSTSQLIEIRFTSDGSIEKRGFKLTFRTSYSSPVIPTTTEAEVTTTSRDVCGFTSIATSTPQYISSPGWPDEYPDSQHCSYAITAPEGHMIRFNFTSFDTESCCDSFEVFRDPSAVFLFTKLNGILSPYTVIDVPSSSIVANFISDGSITKKGFEGYFIAVPYESTRSPENTTLEEITQPTIDPNLGLNCIEPLYARTEAQYLTSPGWPIDYTSAGSIGCEWTIHGGNSVVYIAFLEINLRCCDDYIQIFDGETFVGSIINAQYLTDRGIPDSYISSTAQIKIRFNTQAGGLRTTHNKFRILYQTANVTNTYLPCGSNTFLHDSVSLQSPNYPNNYPENQNCQWTFDAPIGQRIVFNVSYLSLEACCDYVELKDGRDGRVVVKLGRNEITENQIYKTSTNLLTVKFHSDYSTNLQGFTAAVYKETILGFDDKACGFTAVATDDPVTFYSPGYPIEYPASATCYWLLKSPYLGRRVELVLTDFKTEECCDFLEIYDARNGDGYPISSIRNNLPLSNAKYESTGSSLYLKFSADAATQYRGFSATFKLIDEDGDSTVLFSTPETTSKSGGKRCYTGIKMDSGTFQQDMQTLVDCPAESSCLGVSTVVSTTISGLSTTVMLSFGQCLPTFVCLNMSCDQIQNVLPPSIPGNFEECHTQCCDEDLCNQPSSSTTVVPESATSTTGITGDDTECTANDVPFLPGCTFKELFNQGWLCSTLFYNGYPYADITECSTNLQLYQSCANGVSSKCLMGTKPTLFGSLSVPYLEAVSTSITNMSSILPISYGLLCERNENDINSMTTGLAQSLSAMNLGSIPFCDIERLRTMLRSNLDLMTQIVRADNSKEFCRIYSEFTNVATEIYDVCDLPALLAPPALASIAGAGDFIKNIRNIFTIMPELISQSFIPKCLALKTIEEIRPSEPRLAVPQNFSKPDENGCMSLDMDAMFLIDGSGSIHAGEFPQVIEFVKQITASLDLTRNKVGVMQYSHWYSGREISAQPYLETAIELGQYTSKLSFDFAADRIQHHGYTTYTAHAIHKAVIVDLAASPRFTNNCTRKVIIVITDGRSTDASRLEEYTEEARNQGVILFAVGVRGYSLNELQVIATGDTDSNERVYTTNNFFDLISMVPVIRDDLANLISDGETTLASAP